MGRAGVGLPGDGSCVLGRVYWPGIRLVTPYRGFYEVVKGQQSNGIAAGILVPDVGTSGQNQKQGYYQT